jgi:hypothetical protein
MASTVTASRENYHRLTITRKMDHVIFGRQTTGPKHQCTAERKSETYYSPFLSNPASRPVITVHLYPFSIPLMLQITPLWNAPCVIVSLRGKAAFSNTAETVIRRHIVYDASVLSQAANLSDNISPHRQTITDANIVHTNQILSYPRH